LRIALALLNLLTPFDSNCLRKDLIPAAAASSAKLQAGMTGSVGLFLAEKPTCPRLEKAAKIVEMPRHLHHSYPSDSTDSAFQIRRKARPQLSQAFRLPSANGRTKSAGQQGFK
jgi:hypothetical protein